MIIRAAEEAGDGASSTEQPALAARLFVSRKASAPLNVFLQWLNLYPPVSTLELFVLLK